MSGPTLGNPKNTIEILQKYNFSFQKKFGQNFLIDTHVLDKIIKAANITKDDLVLEIGPGIGTMTQYLAEAAGKVIAVEIDKNLIPILADTLGEYENVQVINEDVLKLDIRALAERENGGRPIKIVANLPYYITTPIIFKLLTSTSEISKYVLMMQKEVADRICGKPNTKDYNALSVAIAYRATAKKVLSVPKTAFIPQPNVESAVVRLDIDAIQKYFPKDERLFFDLIRLCFTQRRKTLLNNLSLKYSKEQVLRMLTDLGLSPQIRSEALQIEDFIRISDYLTQQAL